MNIPEIEELKSLVERRFGRLLSSPSDFDEFSLKFEKAVGESVSVSTLKRLWGYVREDHKTRKHTLDILAKYVGHADYDSFVQWLKTSMSYNSSFFCAEKLSSTQLQKGQQLNVGWCPNRMLRLVYLGDSTYEVVEAHNSKLQPGDRFVTGCFIKGYPLYLPYIERGGELTPAFVAGRNGGLCVIRVTNVNETLRIG